MKTNNKQIKISVDLIPKKMLGLPV